MRIRTPHTRTSVGAHVRLVLRNGDIIESKFKERKSKFVVLECGRFAGSVIKKFIVVKHAPHPERG